MSVPSCDPVSEAANPTAIETPSAANNPAGRPSGFRTTNQGGATMHARVLALVTASVVAASPLAVAVTGATAATKHHAGESCKKGKTPPTGFTCTKDAKGKYVLKKK